MRAALLALHLSLISILFNVPPLNSIVRASSLSLSPSALSSCSYSLSSQLPTIERCCKTVSPSSSSSSYLLLFFFLFFFAPRSIDASHLSQQIQLQQCNSHQWMNYKVQRRGKKQLASLAGWVIDTEGAKKKRQEEKVAPHVTWVERFNCQITRFGCASSLSMYSSSHATRWAHCTCNADKIHQRMLNAVRSSDQLNDDRVSFSLSSEKSIYTQATTLEYFSRLVFSPPPPLPSCNHGQLWCLECDSGTHSNLALLWLNDWQWFLVTFDTTCPVICCEQ